MRKNNKLRAGRGKRSKSRLASAVNDNEKLSDQTKASHEQAENSRYEIEHAIKRLRVQRLRIHARQMKKWDELIAKAEALQKRMQADLQAHPFRTIRQPDSSSGGDENSG
jgi:hypothetical protein